MQTKQNPQFIYVLRLLYIGLDEFVDRRISMVSLDRPPAMVLAQTLKEIRPELDLFYVANLGTDEDNTADIPEVIDITFLCCLCVCTVVVYHHISLLSLEK